jgi:diguanylate cyclase
VIFLDVDDFKHLNTSFTESVVDRTILIPLQRLLRDLCAHRGGAYRHGGEELLVILPNCSLDETVAFAEKLRREIETMEFAIDGRASQRLTVSAGAAVWPNHGHSLAHVIG